MRTSSLLIIVVAASALHAGAQFQGPAPGKLDSTRDQRVVDEAQLDALLHAPYPPQLLHADDVVSVRLYGVKDYDVSRRITSAGLISLPLVGDVPAAGFSTDQLEKSIDAALQSAGMVNSPQVSVTMVSQPSSIVTVSGNVARPGVFPAQGQLKLMDYISLAGGMTSSNPAAVASPVVTLIRPSLAGPVAVPLGPDPKLSPYARIPIFAGDEVRVGQEGMIYAVGAFKSQGGFPLKPNSPTTVTQLIALAGGIGYEADYGDAHIVRTTGNGQELVAVNVIKILKGKAPDVILKEDDILYVPTNLVKAAIKGGGTGIIVGLATSYIYRY